MKKRGMFFLLVIVLGALLVQSVYALVGISPPEHIDINFQPGLERDFTFKGFGTTAETKLLIRSEGELNSSITFDVSEINQTSSTNIFHAYLKLPDKIERPGNNVVYISLQTVSSAQRGVIGTSETVLVPINIYVPYPGKYIEASFTVDDVNLGEDLFFVLDVINRGTQDLNQLSASLNILDSVDTRLHALQTEKIFLAKEQRHKFELVLNSSRLGGQGPYKAEVSIFFDGETQVIKKQFKVGKLDINILNNTEMFEKDKINPFDIMIESIWNSKIDNIFAKVKIKDSEFQTPSISLDKWEIKTLKGFWDTTGFEEGFYDANITLFYENLTKSKISKVEIVKKFRLNTTMILISVMILVILVDIIWFCILIKKKRKAKMK